MMKRPDEIHETYEGRSYLCKCEAHEFLARMPGSGSRVCQEVSGKKKEMDHLRVFWYPPQTDELDRNSAPTESLLKQRSVEERITSLILSLKAPMAASSYLLVQFWASTGGASLTLSEQPFGITGLYNGFFRYRNSCIQPQNYEDRYSDREDGPLERVLAQGYPEYCKGIDSYPIYEFPMRDNAKTCGFNDYLALPVFDHGQKCGVLEFLSSGTDLHSIVKSLEDSEFEFTLPHSQECKQVCQSVLTSTLNAGMLNAVREKHRLPLIHIWVPCICDKPSWSTDLVCQMRSVDSTRDYASEGFYMSLINGSHSVRECNSWIGAAYARKKTCFYKNIGDMSISDYPLVHLISSSGLTDCFAIPLHIIHPKIYRLMVEIFLPPQQNCDADIEDVLRSLLTTLDQELAKINDAYALKETEEFCVKYYEVNDPEGSDGFVYYNVFRRDKESSTKQAVENGREQPHLQSSHQEPHLEDSVQNHETCVSPQNRDGVSSKAESETSLDAGNVDGDQAQSHEILHNFLLSDQVPDPEPSEAIDTSSLHDLAETLRKTLDAINQNCACKDVIKAIEKRDTQFAEVGGNVIQESETEPVNAAISNPTSITKSGVMGGDEVEQCYRTIVKATYGDDTVKLHLFSNSGIKELHAELVKRFKLEVDEFKIGYADEDGDWIYLFCNEDLHLYMEALKTSAMRLVVNLVR